MPIIITVNIFDLILFITLVTPYILYSIAYKFPQTFKRFMTQNQLVLLSSIMKTICMVLYAAYGFQGKFTFKYIYISVVCIAIGQYLNYIVYNRLGKVRAYYGWELGLDNSPPIQGFPFDIGHAQYKGCFLTLLGTYLLFEATKRFTFFTIIWTIMYFYITLIESTSPGRKA